MSKESASHKLHRAEVKSVARVRAGRPAKKRTERAYGIFAEPRSFLAHEGRILRNSRPW